MKDTGPHYCTVVAVVVACLGIVACCCYRCCCCLSPESANLLLEKVGSLGLAGLGSAAASLGMMGFATMDLVEGLVGCWTLLTMALKGSGETRGLMEAAGADYRFRCC